MKKTTIVLCFLVAIILGCWSILLADGTAVGNKFAAVEDQQECEQQGGEWDSCVASRKPCGCVEKFSDGGRSCVFGFQCSSKVCLISGWGGGPLYMGSCEAKSNDNVCGTAQIEAGLVVNDQRSCVY